MTPSRTTYMQYLLEEVRKGRMTQEEADAALHAFDALERRPVTVQELDRRTLEQS